MKILLTTLNSKFIHSNLAIRYLKEYCRAYSRTYRNGSFHIDLMEFTINDRMDSVIGELALREPDIIGFSCYIWNIDETLRIADTLKKILPEVVVLLGGPEVSYESVALMENNPAIDYIIAGEGEEAFLKFLEVFEANGDISAVKGLYRRDRSKGHPVVYNGNPESYPDLGDIPFPYPDGFDDLKNKIIYYEMSRGCPFKCQFCLSSLTKKVRYMPMDRIYNDIRTFIEAGVKQVKLVDRTFNCDVKRAREIFKMIMEFNGKTNFHFEIAGDLLDDETCKLLSQAPPGLFQFEIGVQSTNLSTLEKVKRRTDLAKLSNGVKKIKSYGNIHLHLDLIAGLPDESYQSFGQSFNDVAALKPDRLQLGFLKLLKGSGLRINAAKYEYKYRAYPPYEVISNSSISYRELWRLNRIEELVELYYNSHRFDNTIDYLTKCFEEKMFPLFEDMGEFWVRNGYHLMKHSSISLYEKLIKYGEGKDNLDSNILKEVILFDYLISEKKPSRYPEGVGYNIKDSYKYIRDFLNDSENINKYLPGYAEYTSREIARKIHIETFSTDIMDNNFIKGDKPIAYLFDYGELNEGGKKVIYKKIDI